MEDEVDYSDSPLSPLSPEQEASHYSFPYDLSTSGFEQEQNSKLDYINHEQVALPLEDTSTPCELYYSSSCLRSCLQFAGLNQAAQLKPNDSQVERPRIGVHLNRHGVSREDYSDFLVYQGNQKIYEATFLKHFLAHALHPDQLDACLSGGPMDDRQSLHEYLKAVSRNTSNLLQKMIQRTQSRVVKFRANDNKDTTSFWNSKQLDRRLFSDFSPGNEFSVVGMLNQSWHKAFSHPSLVQFTPDECEPEVNISSFEEVSDITGQTEIFENSNVAQSASHSQVRPSRKKKSKAGKAPVMAHATSHNQVQPPRKRNSKTCNLPGATDRVHTTAHRNDWIQGLGGYWRDEISNDSQSGKDAPSSESYGKHQSEPLTEMSYSHDGEVYETQKTLESPHGTDMLSQGPESLFSPKSTEVESSNTKLPLWKATLLKDHKLRLAKKWPQLQQPRQKPLDITAYVGRAIAQGELKRLSPGFQKTANTSNPSALESQPELNLDASHSIQETSQSKVLNDRNIILHPETTNMPIIARSNELPRNTLHSVRKNDKPSAPPRKRQKSMHEAMKTTSVKGKSKESLHPNSASLGSFSSLPYHSGPSHVLEDHQQLPPDAYFEKKTENEQPVWRCGITHCMGYYYNSGDRRNCVGCFTSFKENPKAKIMGFYMPRRSYFFQSAPGLVWKPSKSTGKPRSSSSLSHNSIAKDAYWEAIHSGESTHNAWRKGIEAVEKHLGAKKEKTEKPKKKKPLTKSVPEPIDHGRHPSGSVTMEHGQSLPKGASFEKITRECDEEKAWRCDVNHALGRYYLAGDVKSCHGCGSSKSGAGKRIKTDFYLPSGTIARQKAPRLVDWKPRAPYKLTKEGKKRKQSLSHNQIASKEYWKLVDQGYAHLKSSYDKETLARAIKATEEQIDAKMEAARERLEEVVSSDNDAAPKPKASKKQKGKQTEGSNAREKELSSRRDRSDTRVIYSRATPSLVSRKRNSDELESSDSEGVTGYETENEPEPEQENKDDSSDDESTSESDSE